MISVERSLDADGKQISINMKLPAISWRTECTFQTVLGWTFTWTRPNQAASFGADANGVQQASSFPSGPVVAGGIGIFIGLAGFRQGRAARKDGAG
jgi:hypothetical protein